LLFLDHRRWQGS